MTLSDSVKQVLLCLAAVAAFAAVGVAQHESDAHVADRQPPPTPTILVAGR